MHKLIHWHTLPIHSCFGFIHGGRGSGVFLVVAISVAFLAVVMISTLDKSK